MQKVTHTIYGASTQLHASLKLTPPPAEQHTTLNQKFNIFENESCNLNEIPEINILTIGRGGHTVGLDGNNVPIAFPVPHKATRAALHHHIPFRHALLSNDLDNVERNKYRLRVVSGSDVFYYGLVIDKTIQPMVELVKINGQGTVSDFMPVSSDIDTLHTPTIPTMSGEMVSARVSINMELTEEQGNHIIAAVNALDGTSSTILSLSEVGICSSVTRSVADGAIIYDEGIHVQLNHVITTYIGISENGGSTPLSITHAVSEPMST